MVSCEGRLQRKVLSTQRLLPLVRLTTPSAKGSPEVQVVTVRTPNPQNEHDEDIESEYERKLVQTLSIDSCIDDDVIGEL